VISNFNWTFNDQAYVETTKLIELHLIINYIVGRYYADKAITVAYCKYKLIFWKITYVVSENLK